jgi:hypothetical protein
LKLLFVRLVTLLSVMILVTACGDGGGGSSSSSSSSSSTTPASTISLATPAGTPCLSSTNSTDIFGNTNYRVSHTIKASTWGCLLVNKSDGQPVFDGTQSVRFEIRPGDCNASNSFDDCVNDRSRWELMSNGTLDPSTQGQIITYQYYVYIPSQPLLRPATRAGAPATVQTVLTQLNWFSSTDHSILAGLFVDSAGGLFVRTNKDFGYIPSQDVVVDSNPYNKWIKLTYVVKSTTATDGYIRIYANDKLLINETRATLPYFNSTTLLKVGFYNSVLSAAAQPWQTQVAYFDGFSTKIEKF